MSSRFWINWRIGYILVSRLPTLWFTRSTAVESENTRTLSVKYGGEVTRLDYRVFMDDIDAPDLYFGTSSKDLSEAIDAELRQFADERGL